MFRHADIGRTSTLNNDLSNVTVSVWVKGSDGSWSDVAVTKTDHDTRRMLLDFDAGEVEIRGLRLIFGGLNANEGHGIYEVLAKDGRVEEVGRLRSRRSLLEKSLSDGVSWVQFSPNPVLSVGEVQATAGRVLVLGESHISVKDLCAGSGDVGLREVVLGVSKILAGFSSRGLGEAVYGCGNTDTRTGPSLALATVRSPS